MIHFFEFTSATIKLLKELYKTQFHCVKSVQIRSFSGPYFPVSVFNPNTGKYGPQKTPYLYTFHTAFYSQKGKSPLCVETL